MFEPTKGYLGTNHMLFDNNYVPLTTNNFEVRITGAGTSLQESNEFEALTLSTSEIGEITEEQDVITVHYGNGQIKFPSKVSFSDVDWTLNCFCEPGVLEQLRSWRQQVYNSESERMGLPSEYFRNAYFIRYDGQGNTRDVIKAPGVWPRGLRNGAQNQEGGSLVQVSVTIVISKAIYLQKSQFARR